MSYKEGTTGSLLRGLYQKSGHQRPGALANQGIFYDSSGMKLLQMKKGPDRNAKKFQNGEPALKL